MDEVVPPEDLIDRAVDRAVELGDIPRPVFSRTKARRSDAIRNRYEDRQAEENAAFLEAWFAGPARERLRAAAQKF